MKAFTLYPKDQRNLNILIDNLKKYGNCNCDFDTFNEIYIKWHLETFPGVPVSTDTINYRSHWLTSFINYISNYDLPEVK